MNQIPCLGLNFLAKCSESHITEHFLFNLETAISSLAIIIAIYALVLERRFQVRITLKRGELGLVIAIMIIVLILAFTGSILPYTPGYTVPLLGYPVFWELLSVMFFFFGTWKAFNLSKPITKLTKTQATTLTRYASHVTAKYHGSLDLILTEAEYFWNDFLKKTLTDKSLKNVLATDFSDPDFLRNAAKSRYLLIDTVEFINENKQNHNIGHIYSFFKNLFFISLNQNESVLNDDLNTSYKTLTQHIIRKRKLAPVIFENSGDLFLLGADSDNPKGLFVRLIEIFHMYLGKQYYYKDDVSGYMDLIQTDILKNLLNFFKDSLYKFESEEQSELLNKLADPYCDLTNLPEEKSTVLAEGIYEILEQYVRGRDWTKDDWKERLLLIRLSDNYIECNKYTKLAFERRLLEKIVGTRDKEKRTRHAYNLIGYYPMMIPVYFFLYGYQLFLEKIKDEEMEMHLIILKAMQEHLPMIADGKVQQYFDRVELPKKERDLDIVKNRAKNILSDMFPPSVVYEKNENSITYYFSDQEEYKTILLNETAEAGRVIFKK